MTTDIGPNRPASPADRAAGASRETTRVFLFTTWADDGNWYFLNRLRQLGFRVALIEPLLLRSRWAPAWLKRLSRKVCALYQPAIALLKATSRDVVVTWDTRAGTMHGIVSRLVPRRSRPAHVLRDFHLDLTRFADPVYLLRVLMVRLAAPGIDAFLTTSSQEADLYGRMFGTGSKQVVFFPDTPGGAFLAGHDHPAGEYVFVYGNSDRDFDTVLKAAPRIPCPVVLLSQAWRPKGPLPANVTFIAHRVPQEELIERIAKARVVVIPLKSHFVAAGQNAMLEVMCLSRPLVVTSNLTTLEHATHELDALFCPPRDAEALARSVTRLLADPFFARSLGEQARKTALAFPERQVEVFLEVLERLAPGGAGKTAETIENHPRDTKADSHG